MNDIRDRKRESRERAKRDAARSDAITRERRAAEAAQPYRHAEVVRLMTGQPYRYVCGKADELADVQHPSVMQARVAAGELALWEQRRVGLGSWLVWQRVSEHLEAYRGTPGLVWAGLALTDDVLTHVGGARRCRACSGLGHTWPSDDRCTVCRGHGRLAQLLVPVQGATP